MLPASTRDKAAPSTPSKQPPTSIPAATTVTAPVEMFSPESPDAPYGYYTDEEEDEDGKEDKVEEEKKEEAEKAKAAEKQKDEKGEEVVASVRWVGLSWWLLGVELFVVLGLSCLLIVPHRWTTSPPPHRRFLCCRSRHTCRRSKHRWRRFVLLLAVAYVSLFVVCGIDLLVQLRPPKRRSAASAKFDASGMGRDPDEDDDEYQPPPNKLRKTDQSSSESSDEGDSDDDDAGSDGGGDDDDEQEEQEEHDQEEEEEEQEEQEAEQEARGVAAAAPAVSVVWG